MTETKQWSEWSASGVESHVDELLARDPGVTEDKKLLRDLFSFMDFTTLEGTDNSVKIEQFCRKALSFHPLGLPSPASVCVYPVFVSEAKSLLAGSGIQVAAVSGYFPSGQAPLTLKLDEVRFAVNEGADEIDFVISRGRLLQGDISYVFDEIASAKEILKDVHLKVIIESGELRTTDNIWQASQTAIDAGADFIKTSTGKFQPAATEHAAFVMLNTIQDHFLRTGVKVGFKPAGGIAEAMQAVRYYLLVKDILGTQWLSSDLFRIGASRLADNLAEEILP